MSEITIAQMREALDCAIADISKRGIRYGDLVALETVRDLVAKVERGEWVPKTLLRDPIIADDNVQRSPIVNKPRGFV
jgi:anaerobic selenocysteine-containing dehydrogenase